MDKKQCVIIQHTGKPLTFRDGYVVVYPSRKEANADFNSDFDAYVMTLDQYKQTDMYKTYNKLSNGM